MGGGLQQVGLPSAREACPSAWQENLVRQTPWERFAQSKGIGKHKRPDRDGGGMYGSFVAR